MNVQRPVTVSNKVVYKLNASTSLNGSVAVYVQCDAIWTETFLQWCYLDSVNMAISTISKGLTPRQLRNAIFSVGIWLFQNHTYELLRRIPGLGSTKRDWRV